MLSLERQNILREQYRRVNPGWRPATEVYADLVRSHLQLNSRLLDLGCGRGGLVEQLDHPITQMVGADPDLQSLREHRLATFRPPLPRANAYSGHLPFADESFDLIFGSWVLEHLPYPAADFGQIGRVLRPGGAFVFITPNKAHPLIAFYRQAGRITYLQDRVVERLYSRAPADTFPAYYQANTADDLQQLAQTGRTRLVHLQAIPDPTYLAFTPTLFRFACWLESRLSPGRHIHLVGCVERS